MEPTEHIMRSWDGAELFYRSWRPAQPASKALFLFHRGHEHSGRWKETVDSLGLSDVAIFAWDARGHGRSPGERGAASNGYDVVRDIDAFVHHVVQENAITLENTIVLAHSLAAVNVAAWVHDYAPPIRAMVLATAAFEVKLYVPLAVPALRLKQKLIGGGYIKSYVKAKMLTHDAAEASRYASDPLIFRQIAVNVLLDLHDTGRRLITDAGAILTPTLMIGAGDDWVVSLKAQRQFFERLSSPEKELRIFEHARHAIFHEQERDAIVGCIRQFVMAKFAGRPSETSLVEADQRGYTHAEYERLKKNGQLRFAVARAGLRFAGGLSTGVGLGWRTGFDSGLTLDYVYRNQPSGWSPLGRAIDQAYLGSIGWRGIRQRKVHLEKSLRDTIERVQNGGDDVRILDLAAGPGRYVLETMRDLNPAAKVTARLRDYKPENVTAARRLADEFRLSSVVTEEGDAFDSNAIGSLRPRANIGIVSGLYELFPSNELVLKSLASLRDAIEPDGYLIYTNQPWHPQIEFIAHVLRNREGDRWIMRRRTTAEMDELVRVSGFQKISMLVDHWGMFTVSVAQHASV